MFATSWEDSEQLVEGMVEFAGSELRMRITNADYDADCGCGWRLQIPDADSGCGLRIIELCFFFNKLDKV